MKTVNIWGTDYPIEYTIEAQNKIAEKGGGLQGIPDILTSQPSFFLHVLMDAAYNRGTVLAKFSGAEYDGPTPMEEEEISAMLFPKDLKEVVKKMVEVVNEANKTDVEVAEDKGNLKKTEEAEQK